MTGVVTGAERLAADGFGLLKGRRVGLIVNHTSRVGQTLLIDALVAAPGVELAAILSPEHGLAGTAEAGTKVRGGTYGRTGIAVHSLYGRSLQPTPAMLAGLDVLVFDMQDIGARFYTYISTMGLAMQAAAAAGLPFLVLDRPNPLGGDTVSGFVLEKKLGSFVGRYAIPIAHGMTIGELARMIQGEALLPGLSGLALEVKPVGGWTRSMRWPDTGREWVATSPNIPTFETALAYAGTGLFEATTASEGRGTEAPFLLLGHPAADGRAVVAALDRVRLAGARITPARFTPRVMPQTATNPRFRDRDIAGVRLSIKDVGAYRPVEVGVHLLAAFAAVLKAGGAGGLVGENRGFDRLAGTERLRQALHAGMPADAIIASWAGEVDGFRERRQSYLLY